MNKKTLGIIGFGRIGRRVYEIAYPLKMKTIIFDPFFSATKSIKNNIEVTQSLNELLINSDIITIHCPLNKHTKYMIGENELKKMKKNSYLINTARGSIIDETALVKALNKGWIAGAAIDTFEKEPLDFSSKLIKLENLYMTPHIAAIARESYVKTGCLAVNLLLKVINNRINEIDEKYFIIKYTK